MNHSSFARVLLACACTFPLAPFAAAQSSSPVNAIGLDLRAANSKLMSTTDLAGAAGVRVGNWNSFVGPAGGGQTVALNTPVVDGSGAAVTSLSATLTSGSTGSTFDLNGGLSTGNDAKLFNSVLDQFDGAASQLTIKGIPYSSYDFYVYVWGDEGSAGANDRGGKVTVGQTTYYIRTGTATRVTTDDGTGYVQSSDTNASYGPTTQLGNYVRFAGLSGDLSASFVALNMGTSVQRLKVAGFQIVAASPVPAVTTAPATPTGVATLAGNRQVTLLWNAANTATSYTIKRGTTSAGPFITVASVAANNNTYIDTSAANGAAYFYVVTASNPVGESANSAAASATPVDPLTSNVISVHLRAYNSYGMAASDQAGVVRMPYWNNLLGPAVPGDVASSGTIVNHLGLPVPGVAVSWAAGNTGGFPAYVSSGTIKLGADAVTVGPASNDANLYSTVFDQYDGTPSTLTVTGIPYASYDAIFYLYDGGSARGGRITANGTTLAIRGGAGNPTATGLGYVPSTDAANTSGPSVQQGNYVRFANLTGNLQAALIATNVGDSVQRLKIAGFQIVSNVAVALPAAAPSAPTSFSASPGNAQVALNWSAATTATSYKIYRNGTPLGTVNSPLTSYADATVANGTAYSYTVTALNGIGESPASPTATATPGAPAFTPAARTVYQYSLPMTAIYSNLPADPQRRAYLWIPPSCRKIQGVIVGLHNMLEKPMFDDPVIRQACADANLAIVFISPGDAKTWTPRGVGNYAAGKATTAINLDPNEYLSPDVNPATGANYATDINPATGSRFANQSEQAGAELAQVLTQLAVQSGYLELQYAPILLTGHSAASPFIWTRGVHTSAALAGRVFAILAYKGFFPGAIPAGLPIFHVASEWQEISNWGNTWELGDAPSMRGLRASSTNALIGELVQPGTGHYQYADAQSGPMAAFIKKAAQYRIPANWTATGFPTLNAIEAASGYLVDVTRLGSGNVQPVAYSAWIAAGKDPLRAYWYLDQATAQAVCDTMNEGFTKQPQMINAFQNATALASLAAQNNGVGTVNLTPTLLADGATFTLRAASVNQSPVARLFNGGALGIGTGPILFKANGSGALKQVGPDTFRVWMDRGSIIKEGQPWEPFAIAYTAGDARYRRADRPIFITTAAPVTNISGTAQTITFASIPNQSAPNLQPLTLNATASSGLPVQFWVVSGPYRNDENDSSQLIPEVIPPDSRFPMRVVVGAFQWGKPGTTQTAPVVFQEFFVTDTSSPALPAITTQPQPQSSSIGGSATLTTAASGSGPLTYQWFHDGYPIPGANSATLTLTNLQPANVGNYTVAVTSPAGTVASAAATVTVPFSRLTGFSARAPAGGGDQSLVVAFIVAGGGKPVLVRGVGPTLASFGVSGALPDPKLTLISGSGQIVATNAGWQTASNAAQIQARAAASGLFSLPAGSKDSAVLAMAGSGVSTVQITSATTNTGTALGEIYDLDLNPAARLVAGAARAWVNAGTDPMIAGLTITGNTARTLLIRGVGPTLSTFGISGTLSDPNIRIFSGATLIASNDDWETGGNAAQLTKVFAQVGDFPLPPGSKDAAVALTLQPGAYTVQLTGAPNTSGIALIEVYDVP